MDKLRTLELYRDEQRKVMVIEAVELRQSKFNRGGQIYGSVTPVAVVVCRLDGNELLAVETDNTRLDKLKELHAELDGLVANVCRDGANTKINDD
jgi:uncharacterized spore protein YtfJ